LVLCTTSFAKRLEEMHVLADFEVLAPCLE